MNSLATHSNPPANSTAPLPGLVNADSLIAEDLPCRTCSYNLRGLDVTSRCPECGSPIAISTYGDLLRYSDLVWLETLARGFNVMVWGMLLVAVGFCVALLMQKYDRIGAQAIRAVFPLVLLYGSWLVSEPDPSEQDNQNDLNARKLFRISIVAGVLFPILELIQIPIQSSLNAPFVILGVLGLVHCLMISGEFAKFIYFRTLAKRIPDLSLVRQSRVLLWLMGLSYGVIVAVMEFMAFAARTSTATFSKLVNLELKLVLPASLAYLVGFALTDKLYYRFRAAMRGQLKQSIDFRQNISVGAAVIPEK